MADGPAAPVTDDATLLQRVRQGDQRAMADVFDRYGRAVYSVALRILKDAGHAEDVMQEIFFQIWRNSDSFVQGRGSLGAWLVVVARNRSIDLLRRKVTRLRDMSPLWEMHSEGVDLNSVQWSAH